MSTRRTFLTVPEAAEYLGLTVSYVRKLCFMRKLPHYKPNGGRILFDADELESYVRAGRVATSGELSDHACKILNCGENHASS